MVASGSNFSGHFLAWNMGWAVPSITDCCGSRTDLRHWVHRFSKAAFGFHFLIICSIRLFSFLICSSQRDRYFWNSNFGGSLDPRQSSWFQHSIWQKKGIQPSVVFDSYIFVKVIFKLPMASFLVLSFYIQAWLWRLRLTLPAYCLKSLHMKEKIISELSTSLHNWKSVLVFGTKTEFQFQYQ